MGLLAMALVMVTAKTYREHTLEDQKAGTSELVKVEVSELLNTNLMFTNELALSLNAAHFKQAILAKDTVAVRNYLNSSFERYFVTAGIIRLEKIYAYDSDFNLIAHSTKGIDLTDNQQIICPQLLETARIRTGASRLATINQHCTYEQQSYLSLIVPVGGLHHIGYVQVVTNPLHYVKRVETKLGDPIHIHLPNNGIIYYSDTWPEDSISADTGNYLVSSTAITTETSQHLFTIESLRDESMHFEELRVIRNNVLLVAGIFTIIIGALALASTRKSTIVPVRRLMQHAHLIKEETIQLGNQIEVSGSQEIQALATSFNDMTHRLGLLYQDLSSSNKSLAKEISERKIMVLELQRAHDALAEKVSELNEQTINLKQVNEKLINENQQRILAERQLIKAKDAAESANREKSQFLTRMSHELRTPLNSIIGFSQLMTIRKDDAGQDQTEWAKRIYDSGRYLLSLVDEILDLSSIEVGKIQLNIEPVKVMPLLRDCMQITSPSADHRDINTLLDLIPCSEKIIINADALRLKQIFLNLLSNAVKYNAEGGELKLGCDMPENNRIRISFSDSGEGIDTESQKQLFIPFSRLDADKKCIPGTGVGLAVTRQLTEMMNGKIGVDSEPGKGSTFWVEFDCELMN